MLRLLCFPWWEMVAPSDTGKCMAMQLFVCSIWFVGLNEEGNRRLDDTLTHAYHTILPQWLQDKLEHAFLIRFDGDKISPPADDIPMNAANRMLSEPDQHIEVAVFDIPEFLRSSDFYRSLIIDGTSENDTITIPTSCYAQSADINSPDELRHMFTTMRYWGYTEVPDSVLAYCLTHSTRMDRKIMKEFEKELTFLPSLQVVSLASRAQKGEVAIRMQQSQLVRFLHTHGYSLGNSPCKLAAMYGSVDILEYLVKNEFPLNRFVVAAAAAGGHLSCLQYIRSQRAGNLLFVASVGACNAAAAGGHIECLQYLRERGCLWAEDVLAAAVEHGHLACLAYAHSHGCPVGSHDVVSIACDHSRLDCLKYLIEHNFPMVSMKVACYLAEIGDLELLQLAHEHGLQLTLKAAEATARKGHVHILQYLLDHGVQCTKTTLEAAASTRQEEFVLYALERGLIASPNVWNEFLKAGNVRVLDALCVRDTPFIGSVCPHISVPLHIYAMEDLLSVLYPHLLSATAGGGCLQCVQLLLSKGYKWNGSANASSYCSFLSYRGYLDILQFARTQGCDWDNQTILAAALAGRLEILRYARENGCPFDKASAVAAARVQGHAECAVYLES